MGAYPELVQPLRGIIVPMVTPLLEGDGLDVDGLERLVERLISGGVHGLFVLGTCGEGPALGSRVQREVIDRVCRQVDRRIAVVVGATHPSAAETDDLIRHAANSGADAAVIAPPFYFPLSQQALHDYIVQRASRTPLPLVLYNMPGLTKTWFEPDTVRGLLNIPAIVAMKDSSGDLEYFSKVRGILREGSDWTMLMGPEHLLAASLEAGGDGGVSGGANVWPQLFVELYNAWLVNARESVAELSARITTLGQIYKFDDEPAVAVIKGLKTALSLLGVCSDALADPMRPLGDRQRHGIGAVLQECRLAPSADQPASGGVPMTR